MSGSLIYTVVTIGCIYAFSAACLEPAARAQDGGLKGEYFNGFSYYYDTPVFTRTDPEIDFDWGEDSPAPTVISGSFSVRWTGDLAVPWTGMYTFMVQTEGHVLLRIGDKAVIGQAWPQSDSYQGVMGLIAGWVYPIELVYQAGRGAASIRLFWESPALPLEVVPDVVLQLPLRARTPSPSDGATEIVQDVMLQWTAGCKATYHDIYFGDDANAVENATSASVGLYRGRQELDATLFSPEPLEWNKTYYRRVDEVNNAEPTSPWKGEVWSFTTADFLVIDDFESYTEEEGWRLYEWWIDVWMHTDIWYTSTSIEHRIVHAGRQTMALAYDNVTLPFLSEVDYWWVPARDWMVNGVDTLVLFVRGHAGNDPSPVYMAVEDASGKTAVVMHPDPHVSLATAWVEWKVPLSSVPDVNLTKVKKMAIGVGDRVNPACGGRGTIYIDDIRVIRSSAGG